MTNLYRYDILQHESPQRLTDPRTGEFVDVWQDVSDFDLWLPDGRHIVVPEGFVYDKASVPPIAWFWMPRDDKHAIIAARVHDWLYEHQKIEGHPISRKEADEIFYGLLLQAGMRKSKARLAYMGVRVGGWRTFNRRAKAKEDKDYV